jgi:hypothetical protein
VADLAEPGSQGIAGGRAAVPLQSVPAGGDPASPATVAAAARLIQ